MRLFLCPTIIRRLRQLAILVVGSLCIMALLHLARRPLLGETLILLARHASTFIVRQENCCGGAGDFALSMLWAGTQSQIPSHERLLALLDDSDHKMRMMALFVLQERARMSPLPQRLLPDIQRHWSSDDIDMRIGTLYIGATMNCREALRRCVREVLVAPTPRIQHRFLHTLVVCDMREAGDMAFECLREARSVDFQKLLCLLALLFMNDDRRYPNMSNDHMDWWATADYSPFTDTAFVDEMVAFWKAKRETFRTIDGIGHAGPDFRHDGFITADFPILAMLHHALMAAGALAWVAFMLLWWTVKGWRARRREARLHPLPDMS